MKKVIIHHSLLLLLFLGVAKIIKSQSNPILDSELSFHTFRTTYIGYTDNWRFSYEIDGGKDENRLIIDVPSKNIFITKKDKTVLRRFRLGENFSKEIARGQGGFPTEMFSWIKSEEVAPDRISMDIRIAFPDLIIEGVEKDIYYGTLYLDRADGEKWTEVIQFLTDAPK